MMNRPIEFRAWYKEEMLYDGFDITHDGQFKPSDDSIDDAILLAYTGLTDKNGVKIFEGDIVKGSYDSAYEIKYMADRDYPAFDTVPDVGSDSNGLSYLIAEENIEVIGNIHENPNLLETK